MAHAVVATADDSAAPTLSRHHARGAESARGLLFTILGEFVLPAGRSAWTAGFLDLLSRLGVEEKAGRQALMRTSSDGWLESERVGRRTRWHLTRAAVDLLTEGTTRIYGFSGTHQHWDGHWIVVLARVPERDRAVRHLVRTRLAWAGFVSVSPGVWISTHADRRQDAELVLDEAGILSDALIVVGRFLAGQPMESTVRQAWDLSAVEARYEAFLREFRTRATTDPLVRLTELVHAWRRFPWIDPALPPELLPAKWDGIRAAKLFIERHAQWADAARAEWARLEESNR